MLQILHFCIDFYRYILYNIFQNWPILITNGDDFSRKSAIITIL